MTKQKFTSWGVSFASLALVAGMMSYLGISNKDKTDKTNAVTQSTTQNSTQGESSSFNYDEPDSNTDSGEQSFNNQFSPSDHSFNQHGEFDTTTGGT